MMEKVQITDVTLREYGQNIPAQWLHLFTPEKRVQIATSLVEAGFRNMEVFSCISPRLAPAMETEVIKRIAISLGKIRGVHFITLVPNRTGYGIFKRLNLGAEGLDHTMGIFFSAVESHNLLNLGRNIEETLKEYRTIVTDALSTGTRISAYISAAFGYMHPETGTLERPALNRIMEYIDLLFDMGAIRVTLTDLQGISDAGETGRFLESILEKRNRKDVERLGYHPHHVSNRKALENSKAAFDAGIRRFDASLGGTGGCITGAPGNQPTEQLVELFRSMGVETGLDERKVFDLAATVQEQLYDKLKL